MFSDIPHCCPLTWVRGSRSCSPWAVSPVPAPLRPARGSSCREPAYIPAHRNSLPALLIRIEAVKDNSRERELEQMKRWPGSFSASAPPLHGSLLCRERGVVNHTLLLWWLGILSEHFSLPQFTLPAAQVIAFALLEMSFNTFNLATSQFIPCFMIDCVWNWTRRHVWVENQRTGPRLSCYTLLTAGLAASEFTSLC